MQRVDLAFRWRSLSCLASCVVLAACSTVPYEGPAAPRADSPAAKPTPLPVPGPGGQGGTAKKGGGYYKDDGPGEEVPPNLADIPDAQPRVEPLRAAANRPYNALGSTFTPLQQLQPFRQTGIGSWYGKKFHGVRTSSGEPYDMYAMTAAHPTLPIPSYARVTNLANGRSVIVRVNDRGPFLHNRIIDLSYTAAWKLGYVNQGSAELQVDAIIPDELDSLLASDPLLRVATAPEAGAPAASTEVATASASRTPAREAPAAGSGVFLQLGAFSSSTNAENFREYVHNELRWLQQDIRTQLVGDKYRLHVGPFRDTAEARSIGERIAAAIRVQPFVVTR